MAVEPVTTRWRIPTPRHTDVHGVIGVGADLEPGTVLAAYRSGAFPMPVEGTLAWFSPDPRAVLPLPGAGRRRTLRRARRRFDIRVDTAFDDVVAGCADPRRPGAWISPAMVSAYRALYDLGWAHSVEAWTDEGRLAGGVFGVCVGGLFAAESMFHLVSDASKAAVVGLVEVLGADGDAARRLLDVQWCSDHLRSLGVVEIPRAQYLRALRRALTLPEPRAFTTR